MPYVYSTSPCKYKESLDTTTAEADSGSAPATQPIADSKDDGGAEQEHHSRSSPCNCFLPPTTIFIVNDWIARGVDTRESHSSPSIVGRATGGEKKKSYYLVDIRIFNLLHQRTKFCLAATTSGNFLIYL